MKLLILWLLFPFAVVAQKMPDMGLNKIRIVAPDETVVAGIEPVSKEVSVESNKVYYWYSSNMVHNTEGGYSGKLLNGLYTVYYANKNLKEQGVFKNGLKTGIWKSWQETGMLGKEMTWKNGVISGEFAIYDDAGRLKQSGKYANNLIEGRSKIYLGGDSTKVIKYEHGRISNKKDLTIWQRLYLVRKNTDTLKVDPRVRKESKVRDSNKSTQKVP